MNSLCNNNFCIADYECHYTHGDAASHRGERECDNVAVSLSLTSDLTRNLKQYSSMAGQKVRHNLLAAVHQDEGTHTMPIGVYVLTCMSVYLHKGKQTQHII